MTQRKKNGQFLPGSGGRKPGSRNKLQGDLIDELAASFEKHGKSVIEIVRIERPTEYLKIVVSVLPKELLVNDNALSGMGDDELTAILEKVRMAKEARNGQASH